jgi:hypothetical protein
MPRYIKEGGKRVPNVRTEKAWITIPVKASKDSTPINTETYLVQPRVADYIEKLEGKIKGDLPKLSIK